MKKKMKYSLYKQAYNQFPARDYDSKTKTIIVDLPGEPEKLPKSWKINGNHYTTPEGARVYFWNSGLARNYEIEYKENRKTIPAGFYSTKKVIEAIENM